MQKIYFYLIGVLIPLIAVLTIVYFVKYKLKSQEPDQNYDSLIKDYKAQNSQVPEQVLGKMKSQNYPILLLIGQANTQKTQIIENFKNIKKHTIVYRDENFEFVNFDNRFILVDTPPFDLDSIIDDREKTIKLFQNVFYTLSEQIVAFIIVTKLERTDIIKQNIMKSYKFLNKFQDIIYIMISDFQLSEDKENDKKELEDKLKLFKNQNKSMKNLLYYEDSIDNYVSINQSFKMILQIVKQNNRIELSFKDTIFSQNDGSELRLQFQQEFQKFIVSSKE